jgi:hypothetical protein
MGNRTGYRLAAGMTAAWVARGAALLKTFGPYAALELLLPGGSLIALLLWLYQHRRRGGRHHPPDPSLQAANEARLFRSGALDGLVHQALTDNPDLEGARHGLAAAQDKLRAVSGTAPPQIHDHFRTSLP